MMVLFPVQIKQYEVWELVLDLEDEGLGLFN